MNRFFTLFLAASCLTAVGQVPEYLPTNGLIGWYPFNGGVVDESGNGNDGENSGAVLTVDRNGDVNSAYYFGMESKIRLESLENYDWGFSPSTVVAWANYQGLGDDNGVVIRYDDCASSYVWGITIHESPTELVFYDLNRNGQDDHSMVINPYSPSGWTHYAFVKDPISGSNKAYVNGELVGQVSFATSFPPSGEGDPQLLIGSCGGWAHEFGGDIDDIAFYDRALSNQEISSIFNEEPLLYGCIDSSACNYDPLANVDDDSCIPAGCMDATACNFNDEAGCDDGTCIVLDPVLCGADTIIQVDLCGQDSIQLGFGPSEQQPLVPITQLNWKSSCEFQEGWNLMGFDDSLWSAPIQTICGGFSSGDQLAAQYVDCGGDDHMIWAGDCSSSYFRFPFLWDGASSLYLELGADDSFEAFLNGELIFEGAGWETCYQVDQFENALIGENLLAIQASDIGSCKGLFGKAHGSSFQQNHLWSTGEFSSQIWVDGPGIYTVTLWEENFTAAFIVTNENLQGCTVANACNYNELAVCDDSSCIYPLVGNDCFQGQISCGPGTLWDSTNQVCIPSPDVCHEGTVWDSELQQCIVANPSDSNFDGCVQLGDLLDLLSAYGDCGAEESSWQCGDPLEYQGYDYATVQIGEQCWFAENLRSHNYRNGDAIAEFTTEGDWVSAASGRKVSGLWPADSTEVLYNWWAVFDNHGVCPTGWSVPTTEHLWDLANTLGGPTVSAPAVKSDEHWDGTNESGFSAKPVGVVLTSGEYSSPNNRCLILSKETISNPQINCADCASVFNLQSNFDWFTEDGVSKNVGASVRCIKD